MKKIAALRTFLVFFVGGVVLGTVGVTVIMSFEIIRTGCFGDDPDAVCGDALLIALTTWFPASGIAMSAAFVPVLAGAVLAALGRALFGRVPLWYAIAVVPACVLAYLAVGAPAIVPAPLAARLVVAAAFQATALMAGWWLDGRHTGRVPVITAIDPVAGPER